MLVQQVDESQSKKTVAAVTEEQAQAGLSPQPNDVFVDFGNCHALEQEVQNFVNVEEVTQELRDAADVRMNLPEDHMSLTLDGLQPDDSIDNTMEDAPIQDEIQWKTQLLDLHSRGCDLYIYSDVLW